MTETFCGLLNVIILTFVMGLQGVQLRRQVDIREAVNRGADGDEDQRSLR
jgi:hypothetical protein